MDVEELAMMLHTLQLEPVTPAEFKAAAQKAGLAMATLDQEQQLFLYGLFKQASAGNAPTEGPTDKATPDYYKWQSWKSFGGFPQPDAAKAYVYVVGNCMQVDSKESGGGSGEFNGVGSTVSTLFKTYEDTTQWDSSEVLFGAVIKNDLEQLKELLAGNASNINLLSSEGMSVLHYAADKGNVEMVQLLLDNGADVNILDGDKQSPLTYALICEHMEVIKMLLEHGGDWRFGEDNDAEDYSEEIRELLSTYGKL